MANSKDLRWLVETGLGYLLAPVWPQRWDPWLVKWLADRFYGRESYMVKYTAGLMTTLLGPALDGRDCKELAREHWRMYLEERWIGIRNMHKRGWRPQIDVEGIHHVQEGLKAGRGVIVWAMRFAGDSLVKAGLWQAGIHLAHLQRTGHGAPSKSRLARWLSPLGRRGEARYTTGRCIVIPLDQSFAYMRELIDVLAANSCLLIVGELQGGQNVEVEFFGGREKFATGAPWLAYRMGSVLVSCYVVREGSFRYRLVIEPVDVDRSLSRQEFIEAAVEEFAERVRRQIVRRPDDWGRWYEGWWRRHYRWGLASSAATTPVSSQPEAPRSQPESPG